MPRSWIPIHLRGKTAIGIKLAVSAGAWYFCLPLIVMNLLLLVITLGGIFTMSVHGVTWLTVLPAVAWGAAGAVAWACLAAMNINWIRNRPMPGRIPRIGTLAAVPCLAILHSIPRGEAASFNDWTMPVPGVVFACFLVWWHARARSQSRDGAATAN